MNTIIIPVSKDNPAGKRNGHGEVAEAGFDDATLNEAEYQAVMQAQEFAHDDEVPF